MNFKESADIIQAGLAWANWTPEQQEAMEKALKVMRRYEKVVDEATNYKNGRMDSETFGSRVANIVIDDIR